MTPCDVQASGALEVYFYGEGSPSDRAFVEGHLVGCPECRRALEEIALIKQALAARPAVAAPPGEDWSAFMARLDGVLRRERRPADPVARPRPLMRRSYVAPLAMAALVALVTFSVLFVQHARHRPNEPLWDEKPMAGNAGEPGQAPDTGQPPAGGTGQAKNNAAFLEMSEKHFERSKLVVLGLATRDTRATSDLDWAYERQLASSLLADTRLYRIAAEQRGMTALARVMGDLELVLLQTSMSDEADPARLAELQRLIRKRDLVTKMEVVTTAGL